ncbi:MAG: hypothetical protein ABW199_08180 [Caulobacterales bacterium]
MSKDSHDEHASHEPVRVEGKSTHAAAPKKDGGGGKWLVGAAVAALLVGGGYLAWKNSGPSNTQTAQAAYDSSSYDSTSSDGVVRAAPLPAGETASLDDEAAPASASTSAPRSSSTRTASVPETTIGVTPASASEDDLIVPAPNRPVWTRTPSARRLSAMYPDYLLERDREGEARLSCVVQDSGQLDCNRVSESARGFGRAAERVAHTFRHATTLPNGSSAIGTPVNLRVVFRIDDNGRRGA